jgi:hypothetical protein
MIIIQILLAYMVAGMLFIMLFLDDFHKVCAFMAQCVLWNREADQVNEEIRKQVPFYVRWGMKLFLPFTVGYAMYLYYKS